MEFSIERFDPEYAAFMNVAMRQPFLDTRYRLGWLNYFSHPPLVKQVLKHPRAREFHKGVFLQLSDDPTDMMDEEFANAAFDYAQTLVSYWPPLLNG